MTALNHREQYQSDQGLWAPGLPVLVAGPLLAAIGVAWGPKFLYFHDWCLLVLGPVVLGLLLGGVLALLVAWSQCRNSLLAGGLGVLAGLIAYLGYYHLCLLHELPVKDAARVD